MGILNEILEVIATLVQFVINTITSLIALIGQIPSYLEFIINSFSVLPSFVIPFMTAYVSLIVVQYILNRKAS